jgi:hypothetical protein
LRLGSVLFTLNRTQRRCVLRAVAVAVAVAIGRASRAVRLSRRRLRGGANRRKIETRVPRRVPIALTPMTETKLSASKMLSNFLRDAIAPLLLAEGFRATGRVYRRAVGEALWVVDIQNWKFNDAKRARFTLEVGVCFPHLLAAVAQLSAYEFYGPNVSKPGITECAVRRRIGTFMEPPRDHWWTVSAVTDHVPSAEQIAVPLAAARAWIQERSTLLAFAAVEKDRHALYNGVMEVAALFALGQAPAALAMAAAMARSRYPNQPDGEARLLQELASLQRLGPVPSGG